MRDLLRRRPLGFTFKEAREFLTGPTWLVYVELGKALRDGWLRETHIGFVATENYDTWMSVPNGGRGRRLKEQLELQKIRREEVRNWILSRRYGFTKEDLASEFPDYYYSANVIHTKNRYGRMERDFTFFRQEGTVVVVGRSGEAHRARYAHPSHVARAQDVEV